MGRPTTPVSEARIAGPLATYAELPALNGQI